MPKQWDEQWDRERVQSLIDSQIPEDLRLEFKGAKVLDEQSAFDMTKAVSSMANADGGVVIFGVRTKSRDKDYPVAWDPIQNPKYTSHWFEKKLDSIHPRPRLHVETINLDDMNGWAFVVSVRKSSTVHQASDKKYYQRSGERTLVMEDYQIRDVMNRVRHPRLQLQFTLIFDFMLTAGNSTPRQMSKHLNNEPTRLEVRLHNIGPVFAQYVQVSLNIPATLLYYRIASRSADSYGQPVDTRGLSGAYDKQTWTNENVLTAPQYNNNGQIIAADVPVHSTYAPILPETNRLIKVFNLEGHYDPATLEALITWKIHADNARPRKGKIAIRDIKRENRR